MTGRMLPVAGRPGTHTLFALLRPRAPRADAHQFAARALLESFHPTHADHLHGACAQCRNEPLRATHSSRAMPQPARPFEPAVAGQEEDADTPSPPSEGTTSPSSAAVPAPDSRLPALCRCCALAGFLLAACTLLAYPLEGAAGKGGEGHLWVARLAGPVHTVLVSPAALWALIHSYAQQFGLLSYLLPLLFVERRWLHLAKGDHSLPSALFFRAANLLETLQLVIERVIKPPPRRVAERAAGLAANASDAGDATEPTPMTSPEQESSGGRESNSLRRRHGRAEEAEVQSDTEAEAHSDAEAEAQRRKHAARASASPEPAQAASKAANRAPAAPPARATYACRTLRDRLALAVHGPLDAGQHLLRRAARSKKLREDIRFWALVAALGALMWALRCGYAAASQALDDLVEGQGHPGTPSGLWTRVALLPCHLVAAGVAYLPPLAALAAYLLFLTLKRCTGEFLNLQWDALLLECGFLGVLLAVPGLPAYLLPVLVLWGQCMAFKLMLSSGLVKMLSGDATWRDWTAMLYHYETQPLPHVGAWLAALMPDAVHKVSCAAALLLELVFPFMLIGVLSPARHMGVAAVVLLQVRAVLSLPPPPPLVQTALVTMACARVAGHLGHRLVRLLQLPHLRHRPAGRG